MDECHKVKNPNTQTFQSIVLLSAEYCLLLSGKTHYYTILFAKENVSLTIHFLLLTIPSGLLVIADDNSSIADDNLNIADDNSIDNSFISLYLRFII